MKLLDGEIEKYLNWHSCCLEVEHTLESVMVEYVQGAPPDRWHWCKNCSMYPLKVYKKRSRKPAHDLCDEYKRKESMQQCST